MEGKARSDRKRKARPRTRPKPKPKLKAKPEPNRVPMKPTDVRPDGGIVSEPTQPDPPAYNPGNSVKPAGRLASEVEPRVLSWFLPDYVPKDALSFVVGRENTGKSTFGAWLCWNAKRPAIMPGHEESLEVMTIPRLIANQVVLDRCLILDGRDWVVPHDRQALTAALRNHGADFLWIDPIDSYVSADAERSGEGARHALESLHKIAEELRMAVVAVRHPGKAADNVCPGWHQWRDVPRVIVELMRDDGPPVRRFLRRWKDPLGLGRAPREFTLRGEQGEPRRFTLGPEVAALEAEILQVPDPLERSFIEQAIDLLGELLVDGRLPSKDVRSAAADEGIKDGILYRAARRIGVEMSREGTGKEHVSYWSLPHTFTPSPSQRGVSNGASEDV